MKPFNHLTIAGTFDHLHVGHTSFIDKAFELAEKVSIGLATKLIYQNKPFAYQIQSYDERKAAIQEYIRFKKWLERSSIFELNDIYGISKTDPTLDSIIVTKETKSNAIKVNVLRKKSKLPSLKIIVIDFVKGNDHKIISSSRIRKGEINRHGENFNKKFKAKKIFSLPTNLRSELRKPIGSIVTEMGQVAGKLKDKKYPLLITVGDVVTQTLVKEGTIPDVSVIDLRTRRRAAGKNEIFERTEIKIDKVINHQGKIYQQAVYTFNKVIDFVLQKKKKRVIQVEGEEDLLAIPAILLAPLGSIVLYGLYDRGVVVVEVTEELKAAMSQLFEKFL